MSKTDSFVKFEKVDKSYDGEKFSRELHIK